ncbi:calcium homeostasis modulator protein 2-like [Sinocyclocheilus grahami]|uniref:Calcium homeostasis modulator protein 2-like n=1 Tax=Sinocyclocheilus grahami TaxID=75366 RepID=A0A672KX77_SINGR|nr:PREDICTED: calcium homeostasis modulator protein 2-like [Sinocyclocheilus grahami]XP_016149601.1 PREDICTED: calcium homeostasis modulator protein 2-like [Sinocyclocheilus grahami]
MAALISENFKFVALFFKSKDVMIFNGLIGLGTVASQTAYNIFAFNCPCSPKKNYLYGLAAIGVPALAFFVIGVMLNRNTWDVVSECRTRKCRKLSLSAAFALLGSILGRAVVAPITWSVISLLRGEAYVCALSEFVDPSSLDHFPPTTKTPEIMARFPCKDIPAPFMNYSRVIERQLKYESQLLGWLLLGIISLAVFLLLCMKHCCSTLGYQQEAYWTQYRSNEQDLFQRTAEVHSKYHAAECVKNFFGFVALENQEKQLLEDCKGIKSVIPRMEWNHVTGVYMYREIDDTPVYSRLNKWDMYTKENNC